MPSVSGIQMSSSTRSGSCCARLARASAASAATSTSYPSSARISFRSPRISDSSSTTRMRAALMHVPSAVLTSRGPNHRSAAVAVSGNSMRTRAPPVRALSASILPPCSSTIFFTIASPRPVPFGLRGYVWIEYLPDHIRPKPGPLSSTTISAYLLPARSSRRVIDANLRMLDALLRFDRVRQQIVNDLPHTAAVGLDFRERRVELQLRPALPALRPVEFCHFAQSADSDRSVTHPSRARARIR